MRRLASAKDRLVGEEEVKKRASICDGCTDRKSLFCKRCGCIIKLKILLKTESCPLKKWQ